jgi:hypothetical protein
MTEAEVEMLGRSPRQPSAGANLQAAHTTFRGLCQEYSEADHIARRHSARLTPLGRVSA